MAKLLLLDGNSLVYRAFFALPADLATASGQVTNAVFGFTSMLINLLKDHRPDGLAVAFDRPEATFRHELVADYKAGRRETPDILRQQMGLVREVLETLEIPTVEAPGLEADDVIATLATEARDRGDDVIVVTGDRDAYQLVEDPHLKVLYNKRGVSDYVLYDEAGIKERTGVTPTMYPEFAALRGDPSDNLPGVPGVGEKTAAKLLNDYGTLDGVFAALDKLSPKLAEALRAHEAQVRTNARAIPLVRDAALEMDTSALRMRAFDRARAHELFKFLEFRVLWNRLLEVVGESPEEGGEPEAASLEVDVVPVRDAPSLRRLVEDLRAVPALAIAGGWEGTPGRSPLAGLAVASAAERAWWVPAAVLDEGAPLVAGLVASGGPPIHAHEAKPLMRTLMALGIDWHTLGVDTALAAYLLDAAEAAYPLDELVRRYVGLELAPPDATPAGQLELGSSGGEHPLQACKRAAAISMLAPSLTDALVAQNLWHLYDEVERPLVRVLARMEDVGVRVDVAELRRLVAGLSSEARELERKVQDLAGEAFNVNSTQQLRRILYDKLGLVPSRKTKTGYSTDAVTLEKLRDEHPIVEALLRYREVEKLRSTYGESLLAEVGPDGRIHATFNQTVARTGRLSSDAPNLHNIPVRSEDGRRFRRAFIPADGYRLLVADYNQIELRVIAHLAEDPGLIEAFETGADIHNATAARVFGVGAGEVTPAMRAKAKMVSYGLAYGMEAYGLAQRLAIEVGEADEILKAYFVAFPTVRAYMERTVAEARTRGFTETLFGRRRRIPELQSSNYRLRSAAERQAMNAGIQGLAADIFKVALVRLDRGLEDRQMASRLILQVHDEVLLEVPSDEEAAAEELTQGVMSHAVELRVPLEVHLSWAASWAAAKE